MKIDVLESSCCGPDLAVIQMRITCMHNRTINRTNDSTKRMDAFISRCLDAAADSAIDVDEYLKSLQTLEEMVRDKTNTVQDNEREYF